MYDPQKIKLAHNPQPPVDVPEVAIYDWQYIRSFRGYPEEGPMPDESARHLLHAYYASVSFMDAQLGRVLDELDRPWKSAAFSQYPRAGTMGRSIRTRRYRYTQWRRNSDGKTVARELYDHFTDPRENTNIAGAPKNKDLVRRLAAELEGGWKASVPGN